jgi:nicotinate-nucleotide pyrophosphorylase (carboxylating)
MKPREFDALLKTALSEDVARNDITSRSVLPRKSRIKATIITKEPGILAGIDLAVRVFRLSDKGLSARTLKRDGNAIKSGQTVLTVEGNARSIFAAERTALNVLGHLSGVATLTRAYVQRVRGTRARIFDTRKTLPGLRALEKAAVRAGGGHNHRADLSDAILIKTNHLRAIGGGREAAVARAVAAAKRSRSHRFVEVEVVSLRELRVALAAQPDAILLDNWRLPAIRRAVALRRRTSRATRQPPLLEVSGGVTLANVRAIAHTGVERISIGRLTHSAPTLDVSLEVVR